MADITRRYFLEKSLFTAAAGLAAAGAGRSAFAEKAPDEPGGKPSADSSRPSKGSPNERIGLAVIGLHGRGESHVQAWAEAHKYDEGVDVVALCDVDESQFARRQKQLRDQGRPEAKQYTDLRKLMEDKDVHAVSIATPNHWHTLAGVWAMQAGKDVYVEKPVSHTLLEGRRLTQAAEKYQRICQAGTQSRSTSTCQNAMKFIHSGGIGKVTLARGLCYKRRKSIGHFEDSPTPAGVHYDTWLGPAPKRPFNKNRFLYEWHWNWDYGNGDIGNQGVHQMDIARWALNRGLPNSVLSVGGRFGYKDDGQTPNTQICFYDYGDCHLIFEVRGLPTSRLMGLDVGNIVYGTDGFVAFSGDYDTATVFDGSGEKVKDFRGGGNHFANFLKAVRSRKTSDLNCPALEGHLSSALCHLGNISYQMGRDVPFNVRTRAFGDDIEAYEAFGRMEQHLADNPFTPDVKDDKPPEAVQAAAKESAENKENKETNQAPATRESKKNKKSAKPKDPKDDLMKLQEMKYQLGPKLSFDPKAENFGSNEEANRLLTREYRAPFVVPDQV